jgi:hypothetical protein
MAMAKLCSELRRNRGMQKGLIFRRFHAFIVDHGVRPNSHKEALWVGRQLRSWGTKLTRVTKSGYRLTPARNTILHFEYRMA